MYGRVVGGVGAGGTGSGAARYDMSERGGELGVNGVDCDGKHGDGIHDFKADRVVNKIVTLFE